MYEHNQEAKTDAGKPQLTLVPKEIIYRIAEVRRYGVMKYPDGGKDNWRRVEPQRYWDACVRHIIAALDDYKKTDEESGLLHSQGLVKDLVNDCISRQAAIERATKDHDFYKGATTPADMARRDELLNVMCWLGELPSAQLKSYRSYREGYQAGFKDAQLEQPWIPCSERLPEDEQPILFSTTTGRVHQGRFHRDNSVNRWYSSLDKMRAYNNVVNAWMPLPEPYKEDDHD